eukprot:827013-Pelagomonas_calceolata.AAC.5
MSLGRRCCHAMGLKLPAACAALMLLARCVPVIAVRLCHNICVVWEEVCIAVWGAPFNTQTATHMNSKVLRVSSTRYGRGVLHEVAVFLSNRGLSIVQVHEAIATKRAQQGHGLFSMQWRFHAKLGIRAKSLASL